MNVSLARIRSKVIKEFGGKSIIQLSPLKPFHIKLNYLLKAGRNIPPLNIYIYIFLNLQNERNFNEHSITVP